MRHAWDGRHLVLRYYSSDKNIWFVCKCVLWVHISKPILAMVVIGSFGSLTPGGQYFPFPVRMISGSCDRTLWVDLYRISQKSTRARRNWMQKYAVDVT